MTCSQFSIALAVAKRAKLNKVKAQWPDSAVPVKLLGADSTTTIHLDSWAAPNMDKFAAEPD